MFDIRVQADRPTADPFGNGRGPGMSICSHLSDYGAQYMITEAAYGQCVRLLDDVMAGGPGQGRAPQLIKAIEDWRQQDERLRVLLVELVKAGRVRVPRRMAASGAHHHGATAQGAIICAACRHAVPRLKYAEWQFAHNGTVSYRGNEVPILQAAPH